MSGLLLYRSRSNRSLVRSYCDSLQLPPLLLPRTGHPPSSFKSPNVGSMPRLSMYAGRGVDRTNRMYTEDKKLLQIRDAFLSPFCSRVAYACLLTSSWKFYEMKNLQQYSTQLNYMIYLNSF